MNQLGKFLTSDHEKISKIAVPLAFVAFVTLWVLFFIYHETRILWYVLASLGTLITTWRMYVLFLKKHN